jgi:hypothetical protein
LVTNLTIALIDEFTAVIALTTHYIICVSFFSIEHQILKKYQLESIADKFFIVSLFGIFAMVLPQLMPTGVNSR